MARHMHLEVLAEGVETVAQRNFLKSQGCDSFQGYLFSKPLSYEACSQYCLGEKAGHVPAGSTADMALTG
jgi:EAL domain-containing protein (putative c-di-GMP-specific phosphodiesterase class I)